MKQFFVTVVHDSGRDILEITARNEAAARKIVQSAEGCPANAIISVKEITGLTVTTYGDELFLYNHDTQTIITHL